MATQSNGKLRAARHAERVIRKGLDQVDPVLDPYAYAFGSNGVSISTARKG